MMKTPNIKTLVLALLLGYAILVVVPMLQRAV